MNKHTPGPWKVRTCHRRTLVRQELAHKIGPNICVMEVAGRDYGNEITNAARIVAAVNACEGIPTEALEDWPALIASALDHALLLACVAKGLALVEANGKKCHIHLLEDGVDAREYYHLELDATGCPILTDEVRAVLARARDESEGV